LPDTRPDGRPWPKISIVTPNYNYGHFLEETIRSVLLQGYPDLEYIVIDGGSTDGSVEIIRQYAKWLAYWVSETDRGQAQAINKGFARSTGELLAWLNSDDLYLVSALRHMAEAYVRESETILLGDVENFSDLEKRSWLIRQSRVTFSHAVDPMNSDWSWHQPGMFVPRSLYSRAGPLDEDLQYSFEHDWLCRLTQRAAVTYLGIPMARFRLHEVSKTAAARFGQMQEGIQVIQRYWDFIPDLDKRYTAAVYAVHHASLYLGQLPSYSRFWDRRHGLRLLSAAWWRCPRIVAFPLFWKLCLRAMLPRRLLRSNPWWPSPG
jgi:glycosyltransferase involved in cell wall biosynthesis